MTGSELIAKERQRQIDEEAWDFSHDDEHKKGELADAAICYLMDGPRHIHWHSSRVEAIADVEIKRTWLWPWGGRWWKPESKVRIETIMAAESGQIFDELIDERIRDLTKAGALAAAEIDRLQRLKEKR